MDCALELLNEGKRDLLVSAVPDAVANFSKCCEMLVTLKGELGVECAEAYFYYGKALLELSRSRASLEMPLMVLTWNLRLLVPRPHLPRE